MVAVTEIVRLPFGDRLTKTSVMKDEHLPPSVLRARTFWEDVVSAVHVFLYGKCTVWNA